MQRIGIIGAQSKHAEFFASLFNREKRFDDFRVTRICGLDEPERLGYVLSCAPIRHVDAAPGETIAGCDALLVTTRLANTHYDMAAACLRAGKPVFVDKPFTATVEEATALAQMSHECGAALCGGSTLCFDPQLDGAMLERVRCAPHIALRYRADPDSPFGGYAFYLSHLTDLCCRCFGGDFSGVEVRRQGGHVVSEVAYPARTVVLESFLEYGVPELCWEESGQQCRIELDENGCYANGMRAFLDAVTGAKPFAGCAYLAASVRLMGEITAKLR